MGILKPVGDANTAKNPNVVVQVAPSIGSGGAVAAVGTDKEVVGRVARPLSEAEAASGLVYTPIARIPSVFFVHPSAGVSSLTAEQLADVYAGTVSNWKEVGGADVRIRLVRREDGDSTLGALRATLAAWKGVVISPKSKTAASTQENVETVRSTEGAIGFGPYSKALGDGMVVLKLGGKAPTDPAYASFVTLALIDKPATVTPDALSFVTFASSADAKGIISNRDGIPVVN